MDTLIITIYFYFFVRKINMKLAVARGILRQSLRSECSAFFSTSTGSTASESSNGPTSLRNLSTLPLTKDDITERGIDMKTSIPGTK
jgi:hypothetical protein